VFFPGIPGCGKSALSQVLAETPGGSGDGRSLEWLMGDSVQGKYWKEVDKWRTTEENQGKNLLAEQEHPQRGSLECDSGHL